MSRHLKMLNYLAEKYESIISGKFSGKGVKNKYIYPMNEHLCILSSDAAKKVHSFNPDNQFEIPHCKCV